MECHIAKEAVLLLLHGPTLLQLTATSRKFDVRVSTQLLYAQHTDYYSFVDYACLRSIAYESEHVGAWRRQDRDGQITIIWKVSRGEL